LDQLKLAFSFAFYYILSGIQILYAFYLCVLNMYWPVNGVLEGFP